MLKVINCIPDGLLDLEATRLHEVLQGPTLLHLPGRRPEPLFVSVLLHGNEDTGWLALRALLRQYATTELPRALSVLIGNVAAARVKQRFLPGQPDYNRIWERAPGTDPCPEHSMVDEVLAQMHTRRPFACVDIHNTTGINPHYGSVRRTDDRFLQLATLFNRTVVYFKRPKRVLVGAFADFCPAVTVECGRPGEEQGVAHALEYLEACLRLSEIPNHPVAAHDIDLFHTVAIVKVPTAFNFGFADDRLDIRFVDELDRFNFQELPVGTAFGWVRPGSDARLQVKDETGADVSDRFFQVEDGEIRTRQAVIPSLLTLSAQAIRQDCLCYLMERYQDKDNAVLPQTVGHVGAEEES
ncbi:MAG: peptidase M14, partial [Burkholderiales bacterium]|nr:peptidase M14 [Burkholderiales bacterium]